MMILSNRIFLEDIVKDSGVRFGTSGARGLVTAMTDRVCWAYTRWPSCKKSCLERTALYWGTIYGRAAR